MLLAFYLSNLEFPSGADPEISSETLVASNIMEEPLYGDEETPLFKDEKQEAASMTSTDTENRSILLDIYMACVEHDARPHIRSLIDEFVGTVEEELCGPIFVLVDAEIASVLQMALAPLYCSK